jgi:hypothetical protein
MRWMVDARNKIEKQGELEAHSFVRAEIMASYYEEGPRIEVPAELFQSPTELISSVTHASEKRADMANERAMLHAVPISSGTTSEGVNSFV